MGYIYDKIKLRFMQILNSQKGIFSTIFIIVVLLMLFNIFLLKSAILGLILGVLWLFGAVAGVLGAKFAANQSNLYQKAMGLILGLGLIILICSLFFYLFNFNLLAIILSYLIISGIIFYLILKFDIKPKFQKNIVKFDYNIIIYLILFILALFILFYNQTNQAIRSPWEALPVLFFIIYFLATIFLLKTRNLILLLLHFFLTFIIAVIIYKIGYGFDPFVHRAAEYKLAELGYILPKPFYYLGQYTLVVFLSKIFLAPISLIDKILVPALAALTLPVISYQCLKKYIKNNSLLPATCSLLLVLATPLFFYTVPQSLGNLFLLILIFLLFSNDINKYLAGFLVLIILLIHPLAGLPAIILFLIFYYKNIYIYILSSILIPLFFTVLSVLTDFKIKFAFNNFLNLAGLFQNLFSYLPFYSVYHLIYLIKYNFLILFIFILLIGLYYFKKKAKYILTSSVILIINLILLSFFEFQAVIDYEQAEFVKRLGQIILLVLAPVFLLGIYYILDKINNLKAGRYIVIVLVAGILTIGLYLNYPHVDGFEKNRGFSVSAADIKAVRLINLDGAGKDFVVLANQSTAAASLQEFGFKKYFNSQLTTRNSQLFYYPIPTSSPLYEIYLKMIYDGPSLEYINQARELTGVTRIYFVINDYWLNAKKRIGQAREIADEEFNINDKIWVFRFD